MSKVIHSKLLEISEASGTALFELIKRNGVMYIEPESSSRLFGFLARTVVGQQLSAKAAGTIWDRVEFLASTNETTLTNLFSGAFEQDVRACGISKNKYKAISALKNTLDSDELCVDTLLSSSHENITEMITGMWGFGRWSADMTAIFFCGLQDVYPDTDVAINHGLSMLIGSYPSPEKLADFDLSPKLVPPPG